MENAEWKTGRLGGEIGALRQEIEFSRFGGCLTAIVHPEFPIDASEVALDGVDGDAKRSRDFLVGLASHEQWQHFQFALAQRFDQGLNRGRGSGGDCHLSWAPTFLRPCLECSEQCGDILWGDVLRCCLLKQRGHRLAFVHEDADVAFRLGQCEAVSQ
jgi:hypothetical protein